MNVELSSEATAFGREAFRAFDAAGGDQLVELTSAIRISAPCSWSPC